MAKSKSKDSKKAQPVAEPAPVKNAGVTKSKAKDTAKATSKNIVKEKEQPKKKKVVEPESDSESSDSESESEDSASSDSDSSEEETTKKDTKKPAVNGKAKDASSDSESDSNSDSDSEEETAKPAVNGKVKAESDSESDSDSDSESEDEKPKAKETKVNGAAKKAEESSDSNSSDSDSESEDEKKPAAKDAESSDDSDSDSSSEEESDKAAPASKKRKAEEEIDATPKKAKSDNPNAAPTLFVGSLAWVVDDDTLYQAFQSFEGLTGARVVTDKNSGRSRGFGYVDFADADSAAKAYEAMQGKEVEGRALNLDFANNRPEGGDNQSRAADRAQKHGDSLSAESDTLFVGNLPFGIDQDTVTEFFSEIRSVASVRLPTDPESGELKGFGYVSFNSVEDAKAVLEAKNGAPIGGGRNSRSVRLDFASARAPRDGGSGGGRGGRGGGRGFGGGRGGGGRGFGGGRGGGGGRGRGGGRGGFGSGANRTAFSGTKMTFD